MDAGASWADGAKDWLLTVLLAPVAPLISPQSQFHVMHLLGAFVVLAAAYLWRHRGGTFGFGSVPAFLRFAFPARVLNHPSTAVDLRFYVVNWMFQIACYGWMLLSSEFWSGATLATLERWVGPPHAIALAPPVAGVLATVVIVLALDLGYWTSHWSMHRIPMLWEIHKVHHSAEVMTPLTEWRQHPIEYVLIPNAMAFSVGVTFAVLQYVFGTGLQQFTLFGVNMLIFAYMMTFLHLRHSHAWIVFGPALSRIIQSPAEHQIHHSTNPEHFGKNLGYCLSFWDWVFGTLYLPRRDERVVFGLGAETADFDSVGALYLEPFRKIRRSMAGRGEAVHPSLTAEARPLD